MKKSVLFLILILGFANFASASVSSNLSIKNTYYSNEFLSGSIFLNIQNEPISSLFSTGFNQSIPIKNFLTLNNASYTCSTSGCLDSYSFSAPQNQITLSIPQEGEKYFGFKITGENVSLTDISFTLSSDFPESDRLPLTLKFINNTIWFFREMSENFLRSSSSGCYGGGSSSPSYIYELSPSSMYCEKVYIPETSKFLIGAQIQGIDSKLFTMKLFGKNGEDLSISCQFTSSDNNSCIKETESLLAAGEYFACIRGVEDSSYKIASRSSSSGCSWVGGSSDYPRNQNSSVDYNIFVKTPNYAVSEEIIINPEELSSLKGVIQSYIQLVYNRDCSSGCIIPFLATGISQNLTVMDAEISYMTRNGQVSNYSVFSFVPLIPSFNFTGNLNLSKTGFTVGTSKGNKTLLFYLNTQQIVSKLINIASTLSIYYVTPSNPPAGVPIQFEAVVESDTPIVSLVWDWGDNSSKTVTSNKTATHIYSATGIYTLKLNLTDSRGFSVSKNLEIAVGSPRELITAIIEYKKNSLDNAESTLSQLPVKYQKELEELSNLTAYKGELSSIQRAKSNAIYEQDYINLIARLSAWNVPYKFSIKDSSSLPLVTSLEKIDPSYVQIFAGGSEEDLSLYKNPILQWQMENIVGRVVRNKIALTYLDGSQSVLMSDYQVNIVSNYESESYISISKAYEELSFNGGVDARKSGSGTIIVLNSGETKNFEFQISGDEDPVIYVSPKLSQLTLTSNIGVCNFNKICEKDLKEDYKNCRSDCFPVGSTILWIIILLIVAFVFYTLLALWYKKRYELFLFKDRRSLYNLLMFISNAKISGMSEEAIVAALKKQGWSSEQIIYTIKKSNGQRVGMPEIIPFDKISAYFRNKKAKQNINKAPIQGIIRR